MESDYARIEKTIRYIEANFRAQPSLADIAAQVIGKVAQTLGSHRGEGRFEQSHGCIRTHGCAGSLRLKTK